MNLHALQRWVSSRTRKLSMLVLVERTALLRHVAISVAVAGAFFLRVQSNVESGVFWSLCALTVCNLLCAYLAKFSKLSKLARGASSLFGIVGWAVLASLSGGVSSPFIAGFWLEIGFSSISLGPNGTVYATLGAMLALWSQQASTGVIETVRSTLYMQSLFLSSTGALAWAAARRSSLAIERLRSDVGRLERELQTTRALSEIGEQAARHAHKLKSTIHSLRGFAQLIAAPVEPDSHEQEALTGMRSALDRLERMTCDAFHRAPRGAQFAERVTAFAVWDIVNRVISELRMQRPGVRWSMPSVQALPDVRFSATELHDIVLILLENAACAADARGQVTIQVTHDDNMVQCAIEDDGPGIALCVRDKLFMPGVTDKPHGNGYGLFLARRLAEAGGGSLEEHSPCETRGARFVLSLPRALGPIRRQRAYADESHEYSGR
jgi:signal transduction histidine kinase